MPRTKISEFSSTPANNTDIDSINISEGCAPSGINDAIRELMSQLKDWQSGTSNDPMVIGSSGSLTLNQGTANGVTYLNGSKVVTSGSALTFDGNGLNVTKTTATFGVPVYQFNTGSINGIFTGDTTVSAVSLGSYSNHPVAFYTNNTERMRISADRNLGLGVTPSASWATYKVLQIGEQGVISGFASGAGVLNTGANFYWDGSGYRYLTSNPASLYQQNAGGHNWRIASSGTAGNAITFTQAMTLDSSGNVGIGTSSPGEKFVVANAAGSVAAQILASTTGTSNLYFADGTTGTDNYTGFIQYNHSTNAMNFGTNGGNTRATLDSSGNLGLGVTPSAWSSTASKALQVDKCSLVQIDGFDTSSLSTNAFYNGSWRYIGTAPAVRYDQYSGTHRWQIAASGTAGNPITFTQAMTLDASGNLVVGGTTATLTAANRGNISINGASSAILSLSVGDVSKGYIYTQGTDIIQNAYVGAFTIQTESSQPVIFGTNNTERARIDSSGNFLVGTTSGAFSGKVVTLQTTSASNVITAWNSATSGDNSLIGFFTDGGTGRGSITYNRAGGLTTYNTTSDYRAKDIIGPVTDSGALIDSTPVYIGKMKGATQERPMFIAHETPEYAHTGEKDAVDADGNPIYQQMDASALIPVMWAEIQSLRKRLADAGL